LAITYQFLERTSVTDFSSDTGQHI
jgi:hypothetical protein